MINVKMNLLNKYRINRLRKTNFNLKYLLKRIKIIKFNCS